MLGEASPSGFMSGHSSSRPLVTFRWRRLRKRMSPKSRERAKRIAITMPAMEAFERAIVWAVVVSRMWSRLECNGLWSEEDVVKRVEVDRLAFAVRGEMGRR